MSHKTKILACKLSKVLDSPESKKLLSQINELLEYISEVDDPERVELYLADNLNNLIEKITITQHNLNEYSKQNALRNQKHLSTTKKLTELYTTCPKKRRMEFYQ